MHPHPRDLNVLTLLKEHERKTFESAGGQRALCEKNPLTDIYTEEQFIEIQKSLLAAGGEPNFRLKTDFLMGHFMLLRSQNRLHAELGDIFVLPQKNEGIRGDVNMLFVKLRDGKVSSIGH